jgi:hypothetical protein
MFIGKISVANVGITLAIKGNASWPGFPGKREWEIPRSKAYTQPGSFEVGLEDDGILGQAAAADDIFT